MIQKYLATIAPAVANHLWQSTLVTLLTAVLVLALAKESGGGSPSPLAGRVAQVFDSPFRC